MKAILNYKFLAIAEIVFSVIAIAGELYSQDVYALRKFEGLLPHLLYIIISAEIVLNALLGIIGGVLLLRKNKRGIVISRIWSLLQIPILVWTSKSFLPVTLLFSQFFTFHLDTYWSSTSRNFITGEVRLDSLFLIGVNVVGIILSFLFWKIRFPGKNK